MDKIFRSPMDLSQAIDMGRFDPKKQKLSGNGGPFRVVRFETVMNAFCVVLEDVNGNHELYNGNETKWMNLKPLPPSELRIEYD